MVMYTVALKGAQLEKRVVTLVFSTKEGEQKNKGKTDATGVVSMWGPWAADVRVLVDGKPVLERAEWEERPADRFASVVLPGGGEPLS